MYIFQWDLPDIDEAYGFYEVIAIGYNEQHAQEEVLRELLSMNWSPARLLANAIAMQEEMCEQEPFVRPVQPTAFLFRTTYY